MCSDKSNFKVQKENVCIYNDEFSNSRKPINIVQLNLLKNAGCAGGCKFCGLSISSEVDRKTTATEKDFQNSFNDARNSNSRLELVFPSVGANQMEVLGLLSKMTDVINDNSDIELAVNPGICTREDFYSQLAELGVSRYRNNLENSRRLFKELVPKRSLAQDSKLQSMDLARAAGLKVDTGWLCGLGENEADIKDMLELLNVSNPDSITLNFFDHRESAEDFDYTTPSRQTGLERITVLRTHFPEVEITLGGAHGLWLGSKAIDIPQINGVYVGRFLDHGLREESKKQ